MFVLELAQVVDILVDDNPEAVRLAMRSDLVLGECLRHGVGADGKGVLGE